MKTITKVAVGAFFGFMLVSTQVQAGTIMAMGDSNIGNANNNTFFSNVFGGQDVLYDSTHWSVTNWSSTADNFSSSWDYNTTIDDSTLATYDWFVATGAESYTASEVAALNTFLDNGGSVWVVGEGPLYTTINNNSNALLGALGSSMTFAGSSALSGAIGINADTFTTGVTSFSYIYAGGIGVSGGTSLITIGGDTVCAYETTSDPIPEPATTLLFGTGLAGLAAVNRKRRK